MSLHLWANLHPITRRSIEAQPESGRPGGMNDPACGCYLPSKADGRWYICSYHEGMDVGIELAGAGEPEGSRVEAGTETSVQPDDELLYDAWVVIANAADWELAKDFAGFRYNDDQVLLPRKALPESVEWVEAARRWRDRFHDRMQTSDLLHRPPFLEDK